MRLGGSPSQQLYVVLYACAWQLALVLGALRSDALTTEVPSLSISAGCFVVKAALFQGFSMLALSEATGEVSSVQLTFNRRWQDIFLAWGIILKVLRRTCCSRSW